jgi:hypothetical protein
MKKIIAIAALVAATSASAGFFNNNNTTWNNGYQEDNGIFSFNPYSFWEPRWYIQEANNFMNEIDEEGRYQPQRGHSFPVAVRDSYSTN